MTCLPFAGIKELVAIECKGFNVGRLPESIRNNLSVIHPENEYREEDFYDGFTDVFKAATNPRKVSFCRVLTHRSLHRWKATLCRSCPSVSAMIVGTYVREEIARPFFTALPRMKFKVLARTRASESRVDSPELSELFASSLASWPNLTHLKGLYLGDEHPEDNHMTGSFVPIQQCVLPFAQRLPQMSNLKTATDSFVYIGNTAEAETLADALVLNQNLCCLTGEDWMGLWLSILRKATTLMSFLCTTRPRRPFSDAFTK